MPVLKNAKHEIFAQEYAKGKKLEAAYVAAGYKPNPGNARRLRMNEAVRKRIAEIQQDGADRAGITVQMVLEELAKLGFSNMENYMRAGAHGEPYLDFDNLTSDMKAALAEVTVEDYLDGRGEDAREVKRVKFKLYDKRAALVDIGKHLGMFPNKQEHSGPDGGEIPVSVVKRVITQPKNADA